VLGQAVTYTATVSPAPDGGTVAFSDGSIPIPGCAAVAVNALSGRATCGATYSSPGSHTIRANYSGDTNFAWSQSSSLTQDETLPARLAGAPKWNGRIVTARVTCAAPATTPCETTEALSTIEITERGRPVGLVAARRTRKRHTILVGTRTVLIGPGETKTVKVLLNRTGRKLLKRFGRLPVTLTIAVLEGSRSFTAAQTQLTAKPRTQRRRS
jgi:hypothetical protein